MTSARTPLPTDLVALVSFDGRVYPNEAKPFERLGADQRTRPLEEALEQWFSFATGKHTWVSVRGATIRGLISARKRGNRTAWEVEVLIDASDDDDVALSLFSRMQAGVMRQRAERVFLRLDSESTLTDSARAAGFFKYGSETLYRLEARHALASTANDLPMRMKTKSDTLAIFQVYNRTVPANVRAIEGNTLREWQAAQERWGGRCTDMLVEDNGVVEGWLRVCPGNVGRIYALDQQGRYDKLVSTGLNVLQDRDVFCLVPDYNVGLAAALERVTFEPVAQYDVLAKRLTQPVGELKLETASEAVPVG